MENNEQLVNDFIAYFKSLPENEQFKLGGLFNKETGGKLSPYNSPSPVAVGLIQIQDGDEIKLLGVVRGIPPKVGEIAFPGGFQNTLEPGKVAAAREVKEETGLDTNPNDYILIDEQMAPSNNSLVFYMNKNVYPKEIMDTLKCEADSKGIVEVTGFVLIDRETPMAFPLHRQVATEFFEQGAPTKKMKMR